MELHCVGYCGLILYMANFFGYILFESKSKFSGFVLVLVEETQGRCININLQGIIKNAGFFGSGA